MPTDSADRPPLVSIVIRTCAGRLEFLKEAVASALAQTYAPLEILVVEDGSDEARRWTESIPPSDECRIVYRGLPKGGRSRAGNTGLSLAGGEYAMFLDDDDRLFPRHVEVLAGELIRRPHVAAAYSVACETPTVVHSRRPLRYTERCRLVVHRQPFSREELRIRNYLPIQAVLFRRELFERYGGFDESLEYLEDWDLWRRYSAESEFAFVDEVTSLYRVPGDPEEARRRTLRLEEHRATVAGRGTPSPASEPSPSWLRRVRGSVLRHPWLYRLYWHGRRYYYRDRCAAHGGAIEV